MAASPQFVLPPELDANGDLQTVPTGSDVEIVQRAMVVCATRPGKIDREPGFGLYNQTFRAGGADLDAIAQQLDRWVPEAQDLVERDPAALDRALALVGVRLAT